MVVLDYRNFAFWFDSNLKRVWKKRKTEKGKRRKKNKNRKGAPRNPSGPVSETAHGPAVNEPEPVLFSPLSPHCQAGPACQQRLLPRILSSSLCNGNRRRLLPCGNIAH
jgi:hypothetical protein